MQRNAHDLPVYLGFGNALKLDDLYRLRSIFLPLGKIGGKPSWLNPKFLPTSTQLQCPVCQKQMCFLIQVYATSENDPPHSFHRTLFIFICRNPHCSRPNDPSNMTVFRCCLPRLNPYYSFDGPMDPDLDGDVPDPRLPEDAPELCEVCGCHASKKCGKCGTAWYCCRDHQALDWTTRHKQCCGNVPDPVAPPPLTNPLNKFLFKEYGIEMDQENKGVLHGSVTCPVITNDRLVRKCVTIWGRSLTGLAVGRRKSGKIDSELEFASEALPPVRPVRDLPQIVTYFLTNLSLAITRHITDPWSAPFFPCKFVPKNRKKKRKTSNFISLLLFFISTTNPAHTYMLISLLYPTKLSSSVLTPLLRVDAHDLVGNLHFETSDFHVQPSLSKTHALQ
ncbi:hypothetical protein Y032_0003g1240 [Ancylostoma ceylanicum]|uniref:MYND-type domain-containing protein n=1 Tax=Ancylostoma ceylanicum TaxID=53326 RepID=A0A016VXN0_9BILA|nr:hypothetical protein Y032_0003g1240 [Ancylostoma ceylanicum]